MKIEQVLIINLDRRPDRLQEQLIQWSEKGLPDVTLERVPAVDGGNPDVFERKPGWLKCGKGGWGCYLSHLICLEKAVSTGSTTLILEDDALLMDDFPTLVPEALSSLPEGAGWVYLGGQHYKQKIRKPVVVYQGDKFNWRKPYNVNRTHGYIVTPEAAGWLLGALNRDINRSPEDPPEFLSNWQKDTPSNHIDHRYGWIHQYAWDAEDFPFGIYTLDPWVVHQGASPSDINAGKKPEVFAWHAGNTHQLGEKKAPVKKSIPRPNRTDRIREARARVNPGRPGAARLSRFGRPWR